MSSQSLVEKAVAVSRLMQLSTAVSGAIKVADNGEVFLITPDRSQIRLGGSISDAVSSAVPLAQGLGQAKRSIEMSVSIHV